MDTDIAVRVTGLRKSSTAAGHGAPPTRQPGRVALPTAVTTAIERGELVPPGR